MTTRLVYPKKSVENTGLYLNFRAYNYSDAPQIPGALADIQTVISRGSTNLTAKNFGGAIAGVFGTAKEGKDNEYTFEGGGGAITGRDGSNTGIANISLYLPPKVEYQYGASWNKVSFGALGAMFGTKDAGEFGMEGVKALGLTVGNSVVNAITGSKAFQNIPKVEGINADSLIGAAFGQTFNDNTLQTFDRMQLRSFSFDYLFVARDPSEENEIKKIIKLFKCGMHPEAKQTGRSNSLFLKYPLIWRIVPSGYKGKLFTKVNGQVTKGSKTPDVNSFLPNTKYCALKSMSVDYTPDNVIALTQGNFVQAVRLSLQFEELTALVRQDIDGFEDNTPLGSALNSELGLNK